ncbi:hypothetical protein Tco_1575782 [Tanacetum coccineum]
METCDPIGTPMKIKDMLDLEKNGTLVDATKYQSMIDALMYLMLSRPDIVHATCYVYRVHMDPAYVEKRSTSCEIDYAEDGCWCLDSIFAQAKIPVETPTITPVVPTLPHTSPFLCANSFETSSDSSERPPSQDPYEVTVARWSSIVAARSSPPSLPTHDLPPTDVTPPTLCDSSSNSLSDSSSDYSSDSSSGHSLPDFSFDAPATISTGPSRKRCRFPAASVPLATPVPGALSPVHADLLPPRKRIKGSAIADIDVNTTTVETTTALEVGTGIEADVRVEFGIRIEREDEVKKEAESRDRCTIEIGVDKVSDIESA